MSTENQNPGPSPTADPATGLQLFSREYETRLWLAVAKEAGLPVEFQPGSAWAKVVDALAAKQMHLVKAADEATERRVQRVVEGKDAGETVYIFNADAVAKVRAEQSAR